MDERFWGSVVSACVVVLGVMAYENWGFWALLLVIAVYGLGMMREVLAREGR